MTQARYVRGTLTAALLLMTALPAASIAAVAVADSLEYRIGAEDVLHVRIWGHSDLTTPVTVSETGRVQLPLIGSVEATGRTPEELSTELSRRYGLIDPTMTDVLVTVTEYQSQRVTVIGEVRNPGRIGFRQIPDLWSVIHTAGGTTPEADLARVQIVRHDREGVGPRTIVVDLSRGMEATPPDELPELRARDTVVVPALSEGATSGDTFQILGAVRAPGVYRLTAAGTLVKAVAVSGGPLSNADLRNVRLTRPRTVGAMAYELDLREYLYEGSPALDLTLRPGDTITIPEKEGPLGGVLRGFLQIVPLATAAASLIVALS